MVSRLSLKAESQLETSKTSIVSAVSETELMIFSFIFEILITVLLSKNWSGSTEVGFPFPTPIIFAGPEMVKAISFSEVGTCNPDLSLVSTVIMAISVLLATMLFTLDCKPIATASEVVLTVSVRVFFPFL
ncbi:hypothetical protein D3C72_1819560 [compost metagenome]